MEDKRKPQENEWQDTGNEAPEEHESEQLDEGDLDTVVGGMKTSNVKTPGVY